MHLLLLLNCKHQMNYITRPFRWGISWCTFPSLWTGIAQSHEVSQHAARMGDTMAQPLPWPISSHHWYVVYCNTKRVVSMTVWRWNFNYFSFFFPSVLCYIKMNRTQVQVIFVFWHNDDVGVITFIFFFFFLSHGSGHWKNSSNYR